MPFSPIDLLKIAVGKSITRDLLRKIKYNFDDHEERLNALSAGSGPAILFNEEIRNASGSLNLNGIKLFKAFANMQITKAQVQIFTKDGIASGALEIDLKKSSTLGGSYTSIFTAKPSFNYAAGVDYGLSDGVFNAGQAVSQNEFIRLDITSVPPGAVIKSFRVLVYGVLT